MRATESVLKLGRLRVRELNQLVSDLEIAEDNLVSQLKRLEREAAAAEGLASGRVRFTSSSEADLAERVARVEGSLADMRTRLRNARADLAKASDDLSRIENLAETVARNRRARTPQSRRAAV